MSSPASTPSESTVSTQERRSSPRRRLERLTYAEFGLANGGILIDLSEHGSRFQSVEPVVPGELLPVRFVLTGSVAAIKAAAKVIWCNASGKGGGLRFIDLPEPARRQIGAWVAGELTPAAAPANGANGANGHEKSSPKYTLPSTEGQPAPRAASSEAAALEMARLLVSRGSSKRDGRLSGETPRGDADGDAVRLAAASDPDARPESLVGSAPHAEKVPAEVQADVSLVSPSEELAIAVQPSLPEEVGDLLGAGVSCEPVAADLPAASGEAVVSSVALPALESVAASEEVAEAMPAVTASASETVDSARPTDRDEMPSGTDSALAETLTAEVESAIAFQVDALPAAASERKEESASIALPAELAAEKAADPEPIAPESSEPAIAPASEAVASLANTPLILSRAESGAGDHSGEGHDEQPILAAAPIPFLEQHPSTLVETAAAEPLATAEPDATVAPLVEAAVAPTEAAPDAAAATPVEKLPEAATPIAAATTTPQPPAGTRSRNAKAEPSLTYGQSNRKQKSKQAQPPKPVRVNPMGLPSILPTTISPAASPMPSSPAPTARMAAAEPSRVIPRWSEQVLRFTVGVGVGCCIVAGAFVGVRLRGAGFHTFVLPPPRPAAVEAAGPAVLQPLEVEVLDLNGHRWRLTEADAASETAIVQPPSAAVAPAPAETAPVSVPAAANPGLPAHADKKPQPIRSSQSEIKAPAKSLALKPPRANGRAAVGGDLHAPSIFDGVAPAISSSLALPEPHAPAPAMAPAASAPAASAFASASAPAAASQTAAPSEAARPVFPSMVNSAPPQRSSEFHAPVLVQQVNPVYPAQAKDQHVTGTVRVNAIIGKEGIPHTLRVLSGDPRLAPAAIAAVSQWVYHPAELNGEAIETEVTVDVQFQLR